ncbi:MAG: protein-export membrane protein SecF [Candidatus Woykebacteria bacterium RBG_13_40_15]|uniref:Protein-export membrane protein SecF n=1 Tax=Candidatus Woykebacteria bacterium RBG_13_40_15 TaxID=1802593 RepID=A0A1G1W5P2_9BACT|nr:MAG: protein-export membrane protein SecF [Candidatus Woykebacteria bacterium RBG_13_40_15]
MIDIAGKKFWYFGFSLLVIIPGLVALVLWGLNLGVDFTGGTLLELKFSQSVSKENLEKTIKTTGVEVASIASTESKTYLVRTKPLDENSRKSIIASSQNKFGNVEQVSIETIGPTIGSELMKKALLAIGVASLAIVLYIALAFRKVPAPASSWRFGICAVVALLHDVLVVVGIFSIFGHFFGVEIDALFITALLTIIGFSVHDTIVVFDRIRENLSKGVGNSFADTVNHSIIQTIDRSINTSLTVVLVLLAVLLFGGANIRWFTAALLIGVVSGTYSSVFNAAPLLVLWQEWGERRKK